MMASRSSPSVRSRMRRDSVGARRLAQKASATRCRRGGSTAPLARSAPSSRSPCASGLPALPAQPVQSRRSSIARSRLGWFPRAFSSSVITAGIASRLAPNGPQHVQAHDIARPFPDRVERRLAVEPRHDAFLDITRAAMAFEMPRPPGSGSVWCSSISPPLVPMRASAASAGSSRCPSLARPAVRAPAQLRPQLPCRPEHSA